MSFLFSTGLRLYYLPIFLIILMPQYADAFYCESEVDVLKEIYFSAEKPSKPYQIRTKSIEDQSYTEELTARIHKEMKKYPSLFLERMNFDLLITNWPQEELGALKRGQLQINEIKLRDIEQQKEGFGNFVLHHELSHLVFLSFDQFSKNRNESATVFQNWRIGHLQSIQEYKTEHQLSALQQAYTYAKSLQSPVSEELLTRGFLTDYGLKNMDENFATYAESLFTGLLRDGKSFWQAYEKHQAIRDRTKVVISIFKTIDPQFSLEYFQSLSQ